MSNDKKIGTDFQVNLWGDRLLVQPDTVSEKMIGGLIIPASKDEKPLKGTIIVVGAGTVERPLSAELVGRQVMYSKYAGSRLKINGVEYLILRETDIWADVEGEVSIEATDEI